MRREAIDGSDRPGVYVLALSSKGRNLGGQTDACDERVIYIGETGASLTQRWLQFEGSAFEGKNAHAGGCTYYEEVGASREQLYVSAMPVPANMPGHLT